MVPPQCWNMNRVYVPEAAAGSMAVTTRQGQLVLLRVTLSVTIICIWQSSCWLLAAG